MAKMYADFTFTSQQKRKPVSLPICIFLFHKLSTSSVSAHHVSLKSFHSLVCNFFRNMKGVDITRAKHQTSSTSGAGLFFATCASMENTIAKKRSPAINTCVHMPAVITNTTRENGAKSGEKWVKMGKNPEWTTKIRIKMKMENQ